MLPILTIKFSLLIVAYIFTLAQSSFFPYHSRDSVMENICLVSCVFSLNGALKGITEGCFSVNQKRKYIPYIRVDKFDKIEYLKKKPDNIPIQHYLFINLKRKAYKLI